MVPDDEFLSYSHRDDTSPAHDYVTAFNSRSRSTFHTRDRAMAI